ncbi:hypothetical protein N473_20975 [Pseudoalteromonas luteoviolacea CPMOR-1]|uniref:Uncharacterized protein n=1 Tax=Pseudoalteromonas luteoviolacea CPMOR-1 TaxID=1365248 RepID=A0A167K294_9GAMM|nr:hypothetical protein [Pseudoalteromonas luteoviolacea]KZN62019.1 hypothetical protein N473_20975 [Pseudoalteromonas luteoviolacea CPMOR-1]
MKIKLLTTAISLFAMNSAVASVTLNDLDGYDRESHYTGNLMERIVTDSEHSRTFGAWVFRADKYGSCSTGAVYDEVSGEFIANVGIGPAGHNTSHIDRVVLQGYFSEAQLQRTRVLSLSCESELGESYVVKHKIPAVPKITWDASLTGVGPWQTPDCSGQAQHCGGAGWYDQVSYTSSVLVNNGTEDGYCTSQINDGLVSKVFSGNDMTPLFHTNHFALNEEVYNFNGRAFRQTVSCHNPAGTTEHQTVWEVTGENDINLVVDQVIYK